MALATLVSTITLRSTTKSVDIAAHRDTAIDDLERSTSIDLYAAPPKLDRQGVGIHRFEESGAQHVVDLEPRANDQVR